MEAIKKIVLTFDSALLIIGLYDGQIQIWAVDYWHLWLIDQ